MVLKLLFLNFALAAYLTGVIWMVQLVHYPGFAQVPAAGFGAFHAAHLRRMGWVVMAPMVAELLLAGGLAWVGRTELGAAGWWSLALVAGIWLATFLLAVPFHNRLGTDGYNYVAIDGLVRTNWLRTLAWTLRLLLLGYVLWQRL